MNELTAREALWHLAGLATFVLLVTAWIFLAQPACPQEDSCYPDYANGRWTIIKGERP